MAFEEVKPAFGAVRDTLESYRLNGVINYGESFQHLSNTCNSLVEQVRHLVLLAEPQFYQIQAGALFVCCPASS